MTTISKPFALFGAALLAALLGNPASARSLDGFRGQIGLVQQVQFFDRNDDSRRDDRDRYDRRDDRDRYDRRDDRDRFDRRDDRGRREDGRVTEQLVRDAQQRHNQGVVALQQQFNQRQISRGQMDAGIRQLEVQMNSEIRGAQRR